MNTIEKACVTVIALTNPILLASVGPANVAIPVAKLDTPKIGPLTVSEMPYCSPSQAAINGTTKPAPKAIKPLDRMYLTNGSLDLCGSSWRQLTPCLFSLLGSLTRNMKSEDDKLRIAIIA